MLKMPTIQVENILIKLIMVNLPVMDNSTDTEAIFCLYENKAVYYAVNLSVAAAPKGVWDILNVSQSLPI